jgi:Coenzyme PQQ synthesis protein D (PqqD)
MASSKALGPDSIVRVSSSQVSSRLGDEVAILELDRGVYYGLNDTGSFLWNLMQKPVRVNEMRAALVEEFDVDAEIAEKDLLRVLGDLRDAGLIEHVDLSL